MSSNKSKCLLVTELRFSEWTDMIVAHNATPVMCICTTHDPEKAGIYTVQLSELSPGNLKYLLERTLAAFNEKYP